MIECFCLHIHELEMNLFQLMIWSSLYWQIYFQDLSCSKPELKLPSTPCSPIIDPHLSPDGTMLGYVKDSELHVLTLSNNESRQLTFGARGDVLVSLLYK